jgi:hypothetical protein
VLYTIVRTLQNLWIFLVYHTLSFLCTCTIPSKGCIALLCKGHIHIMCTGKVNLYISPTQSSLMMEIVSNCKERKHKRSCMCSSCLRNHHLTEPFTRSKLLSLKMEAACSSESWWHTKCQKPQSSPFPYFSCVYLHEEWCRYYFPHFH